MSIHAGPVEVLARAAVLVDGRALVVRARGASNVFLPGGHVEPGEPIVTALRRELAEEGGLECTGVEPLGVVEHAWDDDGRTRHEINHVFAVAIPSLSPSSPPTSLEPALSFAWVPLDDLDDANLKPAPLRALLRLTSGGWRGPFFESTLPNAVDVSRVVVRRVHPRDAERLRTARLYSLAETPTAFGASLADDLAQPPERWLAWASNDGVTVAADGRLKITFVADDGDAIRGMASGIRGDRLELMAMWVHASCRGSDVAARLVDEVIAWGRARGEPSISLFVSSTNERARRFYTRLGFAFTGESFMLASRPTIKEERMTLALV